ncbi:diguanylate cyclase, partial [Nitrospira defluvii]|nr:diguanylate cyclase [Nitrospira defluvii]
DRTMELRETVERLQEMDRLKSEFLSNISHELRTPLTSIIGFSEILLDQVSGDLNEAQMGYVRNMFDSGHNLLEIISNLLDLSKIRSGRMQINLRPCQLNDILDSVITTITPLIEKKQLRLNRVIEASLPEIFADEGKVRQILLNLLSNAVKFTGEGGAMTLSGKMVELEGKSFAEISVADTGVGIRQSDLSMIFDEFRQVDASYTRDNPGTGLGLPITKHFVEMHRGQIRVKSVPGEGSIFTFLLPAGTPTDKQVIDEPRSTEAAIENKRQEEPAITAFPVKADTMSEGEKKNQPIILVVEDDRQASELIGLYLTREGYQVVYAFDGYEALELARDLIPFAITLDIMLPGKDGWQVLEELQSMSETKDIPVVILSIVEDQETGFSLGAVDYLLKPLDKNALLRSLAKLDLAKRAAIKPVTILLIEHNPEVTKVIKGILAETTFGVISATEVEDGITLALDGRPDLILLGLTGFSNENGINLPQKLSKYRIIKDIPMIVYLQEELTDDMKKRLEGEIRKIFHYDARSIREELLSEIKKYEKLYPDKARMVDGLTGLYNERYLKSRLSDEVDRALRYKRTFSLIATNIDYFKDYNERFGSAEGDRALKAIGDIFRENLRLADPVSRLGGSTFMILMTETIQRSGVLVAEKLRKLVESFPFPHQDGKSEVGLTLSVGVATFIRDAKTDEEILGQVFNALQKAKEEGGNRMICADPIKKSSQD